MTAVVLSRPTLFLQFAVHETCTAILTIKNLSKCHQDDNIHFKQHQTSLDFAKDAPCRYNSNGVTP
jgi:hypothetical protein